MEYNPSFLFTHKFVTFKEYNDIEIINKQMFINIEGGFI